MDKLTSKQIHNKVAERSKGKCELCTSSYLVEHHHILGGQGKRRQYETVESIIALCWYCHKSKYGVHGKNGRTLNLLLKQRLQETYFKQGYTEDEVREMMGGKLYE